MVEVRTQRLRGNSGELVRRKVDVSPLEAPSDGKAGDDVDPIVFAVAIDLARVAAFLVAGKRRRRYRIVAAGGEFLPGNDRQYGGNLIPRLHRSAIIFNGGTMRRCWRWVISSRAGHCISTLPSRNPPDAGHCSVFEKLDTSGCAYVVIDELVVAISSS